MRIMDQYLADWNGLTRKASEFTHSLYHVKMIVGNWDYYTRIPRPGKDAFVKLITKTMADDRRLILKPELAVKLSDLCPEKYKIRFDCAARARVHNEIQDDLIRYLSYYFWQFEDELGEAPVEVFYRRYLDCTYE